MGPMDAVNAVKEVAELVKKANDIPLYQKLVELQGQVTDLAGENFRLSNENHRLKEEIQRRASTKFKNPYYFENDDTIPLCPKCFVESDGKKRAHLSDPPEDFAGGHGRICVVCNSFYREGPRHSPLPGAVGVRGMSFDGY